MIKFSSLFQLINFFFNEKILYIYFLLLKELKKYSFGEMFIFKIERRL